jgi:hypothetical protein
MLQVYRVKVDGYLATGKVDIGNETLDVDISFYIDSKDNVMLEDVVAWDGNEHYDLSERADLVELEAAITHSFDWISHEMDIANG